MCGLGAILRLTPPGTQPPAPELAIPDRWLETIDQSITYRGPDDHGRFRDRTTRRDGTTADVALIHRRLSIIDPEGGHQPMLVQPEHLPESARTERIAVVFNGCIYNHRELRSTLTARGHQFQTDHSDTEVIPHAWAAWRAGAFHRLTAMAAIVLWDAATGSLIAFRSSPGEKPLYAASATCPDGATLLAFSSNAAGLERLTPELAWEQTDPPQQATLAWLADGHHPRCTPTGRIWQLPSGRVLINEDRIHASRHSTPAPPRRHDPAQPEVGDPVAQFEQELDRVVSQRLDADVAIGCFLSGGIDSSLVTTFATRHHDDLLAICVRMPTTEDDESKWARAVAEHCNIPCRFVDAPAHPAEDLVKLIHTMGLPFGDSSILPTYWASKAAAEECGVALTGDGGDELFLGYDRHAAARWLPLVGPLGRAVPTGLLNRSHQRSTADRLARFTAACCNAGYPDLVAIFQSPDLAGLTTDPTPPAQCTLWRGPKSPTPSDPLEAARFYDLLHYLEGDLLRKMDTASMLARIEVRAPLLDQDFVAHAMALPAHTARLGRRSKGLLRAIAARHLPEGIAYRPKKGFSIPIGDWFRDDFGGMRTLLHDHLRSADPFPGLPVEIGRGAVDQLLDEHDAVSEGNGRDHAQRLFVLLSTSIWARRQTEHPAGLPTG